MKQGLVLDRVVLLGRTLEEYARYFALDPAAWAGKAILDVASGVGSAVGSDDGSAGGAEGSADALLSGGGEGSVASAANGVMSVEMKTTSVKMTRTRSVTLRRSGLGTGFPSTDGVSRRAVPAGRQP